MLVQKVSFALALALGLAAASQASAATLTLSDGPGNTLNGGAFVATFTNLPQGVTVDPFYTFCLERNEYFSLNTQYTFDIGNDLDDALTGAEAGGLGGAANGHDPLSAETQWLYRAFMRNELAGYNPTVGGTLTDAGGSALQLAIWHLEGELTDTAGQNAYNGNAAAQALVGLANSHSNFQTNTVYVMNLVDSNGTKLQSQLFFDRTKDGNQETVPEPGTVALLGGAAVSVAYGRSARRRHA